MERNAQFIGLQRQQTKREQTQFPVGEMLLPDLLPSSYFPPQTSQAALSSGVQGCGCTAEGEPWYQSTVQRGGVTRAGVWDGVLVGKALLGAVEGDEEHAEPRTPGSAHEL